MEIKRLITQVAYRIEPKPGGGFIARTSDPNVPPLEAPTREELLQQIQAKIAVTLSTEFPSLKLSPDGQGLSFQIGKKLSGHLTPTSADLQLRTAKGEPSESGHLFAGKAFAMGGSTPTIEGSTLAATQPTYGSSGSVVGNRPIVPEGGSWTLFRFLLLFAVIVGMVYFFVHR